MFKLDCQHCGARGSVVTDYNHDISDRPPVVPRIWCENCDSVYETWLISNNGKSVSLIGLRENPDWHPPRYVGRLLF